MGKTKFCSVCGAKLIEPTFVDDETVLCEACFFEYENYNQIIENFDNIE